MAKKNIFQSRKLKYGSLSTALTIAFVAVILILNIVCTTLTTNYSLKLDISGDGLYALDTQTLQIIDKNERDIKFYVYSAEKSFTAQFSEVLRRIVNKSSHFSLEFVDPNQNPTFASSFGSQYNIGEGALVMESGGKIRVVAADEMYSYDQNSGAVSYLLEERVASAIMSFIQDREEIIYFVTGHGESTDTTFRNLFANNGYTVKDISLYKDMSFDEKATLMIIAAPTRDYSAGEVAAVDSFLSNQYEYGRNLMFFSGAASVEMPNLEGLLYEWGFEFGKDMVIESDANRYISLPTIFRPDVASDDLTEQLTVSSVPLILSASRSVTTRFEENGNLKVAPVLMTGESAYAKSTQEGGTISTYNKEDGDVVGPFAVAALSQNLKVYNNQNVYSHVFVSGSSDMLISDYMAYADNGDFLINLYDMMMQRESDTILSAVKYAASESLILTEGQKMFVNIIVMALIPGIVLIVGIIVFIRRRYL